MKKYISMIKTCLALVNPARLRNALRSPAGFSESTWMGWFGQAKAGCELGPASGYRQEGRKRRETGATVAPPGGENVRKETVVGRPKNSHVYKFAEAEADAERNELLLLLLPLGLACV